MTDGVVMTALSAFPYGSPPHSSAPLWARKQGTRPALQASCPSAWRVISEETRMRLNRSLLLATAALCLVGARPANAQNQRRIVVTPFAGVFVPATKVAQIRSGVGGTDHVTGIRQQSALALGANASYWFNNLTGVEVGGAWAFSDARPTVGLWTEVPGSLSGTESARVLFASAK